MPGLPSSLYRRCRETLLKCDELGSDRLLAAVFIAEELQSWRSRLPAANSQSERVDLVLGYLQNQRSAQGSPILPIFIAALRDRYQPDDVLWSELDRLYNALTWVLSPESERSPDAVPPTEQDPASSNSQAASTQAASTQASGSQTSIGTLHNNEGIVITGGNVTLPRSDHWSGDRRSSDSEPQGEPSGLRQRLDRQRLDRQRHELESAWNLSLEKLSRLKKDWVIEAGTATKFQLEQQIKAEEASLAELESQLAEIEDELRKL